MPQLLRVRNLVFASAAIWFIYYALSSWSASPRLESVMIVRYMNQNSSAGPTLVKSSFDWGSVNFTYPPGPLIPLPSGRPKSLPPVQHVFGKESSSAASIRESRRQEVRKLFQKNWQSYREYAWLSDALQPLSATGKDQFCGWSATLVDSLDTLWIMGLREEFDEAVAEVAKIDFGQSTAGRVNTFETNIRYLGGLMAAYDLSGRRVLLQKAVELGDLIYGAFNTDNRMPVDFIDFAGAKTGDGLTVEDSVVSASPGTLSLELTHLSQLTGDPKYYDAIARVMDLFHSHQTDTMLPGMWPTFVSMKRQDVKSGNEFTVAGCADSLYEYLPKMHALLGGLEPKYETMSRAFMAAANASLLFRPMTPGNEDILIAGNMKVNDAGKLALDPESEHLACFIGGVYALGGKLFKSPAYLDIGTRLTAGCYYAYQAFPTGMMPERYNMVACKSRQDCQWNDEIWLQETKKRPEFKDHLPKGFTTAKDPRYILRPEAIESVFISYRITGRPAFQEAAWEMWKAVSNGTLTEYANAAVKDVTSRITPLEQEDYMESFWLAETLKYFYLVFSPPDLISLDDYVLNTEAHPFRRPK